MPARLQVACYCTSYRCNGQKQTQRQWNLHQREDKDRASQVLIPLTSDASSSDLNSRSLPKPEASLEKSSPVLPEHQDSSSTKKHTPPPPVEKKTTPSSDTPSIAVEELFKHILALDNGMDERFRAIQELKDLDPLNPLKLAPSAMLKKFLGEREWVGDTVRRVGLTPTLGSEAINIQKLAMKKRGQGILQVINEMCAEMEPEVPSDGNGDIVFRCDAIAY